MMKNHLFTNNLLRFKLINCQLKKITKYETLKQGIVMIAYFVGLAPVCGFKIGQFICKSMSAGVYYLSYLSPGSTYYVD